MTIRHGRVLLALAAALAAAFPCAGDDKDLLKSGSSKPNVVVIISNTVSMQYLPYVQGSTPILPPDGQFQDSPQSKFGIAKTVFRQVVEDNNANFNFGLSWYSYHQEVVTHKYWSYRSTANNTISGAAYDFPGDAFQAAVGTYYELGTSGGGPIQSISTTQTYGIAGTTISGVWFGDVPAASSCTAATCTGYSIEQIDKSHRVAVHLSPVNGGQPYGQPTITMIKEYQAGTPPGNPTSWTTQASTPAGNAGTVSITLSPPPNPPTQFPNLYSTGSDNGLYMGFMKAGDWNLNSDCGGWFVQNTLPAIGVPRDYISDLACTNTTCSQPPEVSWGCVLRYTRPQSSVIHYAPGSTGTYSALSPPDDNPGVCSASVVHTGTGPEDQIVLMSTNDSHIPEANMFKNVDDYFNTEDCFVNGVRTDDPNKSCRTGAVILLSDTFNACGPDCSQTSTSKYLVSLKSHHIPVYVISLGVPDGTAQATEAHCIALNSGSEDAVHPGVFSVTSTDPQQVSQDLSDAFAAILTRINEATEDFASATISSVHAGTGQMAFLATFNARKNRSIWDGAMRAYKLQANGSINPDPVAPNTHSQNPDGSNCVTTVRDANDPLNNITLDSPCNQFPILQWNAQINLAAVPLAPSNASGIADLAANTAMTKGSTYSDTSNDTPHNIPIFNYPGRRILWSLPSTVAASSSLPTTLPINGASASATEPVPETNEPFLVSTSAAWWPKFKLLITSQAYPPNSGNSSCTTPPCTVTDTSASQTVRFIRGDRDSVINERRTTPYPSGDAHYYASPSGPLKLGDIFHSNPQLVAEPENVFYYTTNLHNYQDFFNKHRYRRRILYTGANDGMLHAFDVGVWDRDTTVCTGGQTDCYDLGTGAELFGYIPRSIMQPLRRLKNSVGPQTKQDEWTVDGAPSGADMFLDVKHSGTPNAANRAWRTILVGGAREGSAFEGQTPCPAVGVTGPFQSSASSIYALDVTQPEKSDGNGVEGTGGFNSPGCLDGGSNCSTVWPSVLWEIQDTNDDDANGYPDMGESWSKPGLGRICLATNQAGNCTDERYVAIFGGGFDRERKNRRGNWIYIVDVETGFVLYKTGSGTANFGSGNVTVNFASVPSEVSAIDVNNDGLLDFVYFGDLLGQLWRLDLRGIRVNPSAPTTRWASKLQKNDGSALTPMLVFQAPQPVSPSFKYYPIYYRPTVVYIGVTSSGQPMLGLAFGTGDRDDITAICDASTRSSSYNQRFYFVVDQANTKTVTESTSGMLQIAASSAATTTTVPTVGWYALLGTSSTTLGERVITDSLAINKYIYFFTDVPAASSTTGGCSPPSACNIKSSTVRQYTMYYANGNPLPPATDRAATVANASFATNPIFYVAADQSGNVAFTTNHGVFTPSKTNEPTKSNVKDWKEN
ncbi:MAG TPA: PilC/PilY family type IV pilus protein [Thermoanaerobaculia bacterium]|nr:PilC/PilY family type IV pilus protein [Thermoanaerobaculia bacterium]